VPVGDLTDHVQSGRLSEGVHGENRLGPRGYRGLDEVNVDVGRVPLDVDADRLRALVQDAVAGGDETERCGNDLVAVVDAEGADEEVEAAGCRS